jgi:hypothetical protein
MLHLSFKGTRKPHGEINLSITDASKCFFYRFGEEVNLCLTFEKRCCFSAAEINF